MKLRAIWLLASVVLAQGCSIISSSMQPPSRPPEEIVEGCERDWVDHNYGFPIATGFTADGTEYVEQIQFVDGVPMGWKVFRIVLHSVADTFTYFLWEFIGFPMELALDSHPEYVYYLVYDENDQLVRKIPEESIEGISLSKLEWSSPRLPTERWGRAPSVSRMTLDERMELINAAKGNISVEKQTHEEENESVMQAEAQEKKEEPIDENLSAKLKEIKKLHEDKVIDDETYKSMIIRLVNQ